MAVGTDGRYYAEAEVKAGKGFSKEDAETAQAKLDAAAKGEEYVAAPKADAEVVDPASHPAAGGLTIAETQKKDRR